MLNPQDTPYLALTSELCDVFCEYGEKVDRVITTPHCSYLFTKLNHVSNYIALNLPSFVWFINDDNMTLVNN